MYEMNYGESRRPRSNEKWMGTFKPNNSLASLSDDWPISRGDSLVCLPREVSMVAFLIHFFFQS